MTSPTTFGKLLARHRKRLGRPVTLDELFDLHDASNGSGSLSGDERSALLDRVAADPEAARKLLALVRFSETTAEKEAEGVEGRWSAFREQLDALESADAASPQNEPDETLARLPSRRGPSRLRYAALAASLLLCSTLAFWLGRTQGSGTVHDPVDFGISVNTQVVELTTEESTPRGTTPIDWPSNAQTLLISLSAPEIDSKQPLLLVVLDAEGEVISSGLGIEPDDAGLYFATLSRDLMELGLYEIQLQDDQRRTLAAFSIEVRPSL